MGETANDKTEADDSPQANTTEVAKDVPAKEDESVETEAVGKEPQDSTEEHAGEDSTKDSSAVFKKDQAKKKRAFSPGEHEELIKAGTIKRIMKIDKQVKMTGSEAVYLVSKATELFLGRIMQKAVSSHGSNPKSKSIHYNDVARTVRENSEMDFLVDLLPEV